MPSKLSYLPDALKLLFGAISNSSILLFANQFCLSIYSIEFATYGGGTAINTNTNRFSENVTGYDKNGNIKTLQRYGQTTSSD